MLLHFDEFFDEIKHCAQFQQETRQDALIALGQHVFTRKIILISYTSVSVSALISLHATSKTNDLKCSYEKGNLIHRGLRVKETYLSKCVM